MAEIILRPVGTDRSRVLRRHGYGARALSRTNRSGRRPSRTVGRTFGCQLGNTETQNAPSVLRGTGTRAVRYDNAPGRYRLHGSVFRMVSQTCQCRIRGRCKRRHVGSRKSQSHLRVETYQISHVLNGLRDGKLRVHFMCKMYLKSTIRGLRFMMCLSYDFSLKLKQNQ